MRIWLLALASCWTGPVAPALVAPAAFATPVAARPTFKPGGYFVPDLISHRLETHAFDEVDALGAELAVFEPGPAAFQRRAIPVRSRDLLRPAITLGNSFFGNDPRLVVEYCIDVTGRVTSAHVAVQDDELQSAQRTMGLAKDQNVLERLRGWRFTPYFVDGKPVMACSFIDYSTTAP